MLKIKTDNPNYLAKVVQLPEPREHPNADRLNLVTVDFQTVIVGKDAKQGELFILFPIDTEINKDFLSFTNNFRDKKLNIDQEKTGFFYKPRVKATKLRGVMSEGYLHPVESFNNWLKEIGINYQVTDSDIGTEFDTIKDVEFCKKYINPALLKRNNHGKQGGKVKRESKIVDNQFRLSPDYKHLKREIKTLNPDDFIEITSKWHGCNACVARLLTKRKLTIRERILRKLGVKIDEKEYNLVYSSRRVIKSDEFRDNPAESFYDSNVWEIVAKKYQEGIKEGISCYGEVVGYTPTGGAIQSVKGVAYDYGCDNGTCDFYVFRITYTSLSGDVYEFSLPQVIEYCNTYGLKHVPVYYIGRAKDKYPDLDTENHWHESFLEKLIEEYLEKDDIYCNNTGLADEGIVLSKRVGGFVGLKLKSQRFILGESEELDNESSNVVDE